MGGCGADGCDTFLIRGVSSSESAWELLFLAVEGWCAIGWRVCVRACVRACVFGG